LFELIGQTLLKIISEGSVLRRIAKWMVDMAFRFLTRTASAQGSLVLGKID
jgi:hypothetical protein